MEGPVSFLALLPPPLLAPRLGLRFLLPLPLFFIPKSVFFSFEALVKFIGLTKLFGEKLLVKG